MEDALLRMIVWFIHVHITNLIRVPPSIASVPQKRGNEFAKYKAKMFDLNLLGFCQLYHLIAYFGCPITSFEWILLFVLILGAILRFWSYYTLGKYFTFEIQVQDNQKIISSGPYGYFAHPGYMGQFLMFMSSIIFYAIHPILNFPLLCSVYQSHNEEEAIKIVSSVWGFWLRDHPRYRHTEFYRLNEGKKEEVYIKQAEYPCDPDDYKYYHAVMFPSCTNSDSKLRGEDGNELSEEEHQIYKKRKVFLKMGS